MAVLLQAPPWEGERARLRASVVVNSGVYGQGGAGPSQSASSCLTHTTTNRDIISPGGAADSDAWPDAGKGVPVIANSKEWLKNKKMHHSVAANDNNTFLFILIQKQFFSSFVPLPVFSYLMRTCFSARSPISLLLVCLI